MGFTIKKCFGLKDQSGKLYNFARGEFKNPAAETLIKEHKALGLYLGEYVTLSDEKFELSKEQKAFLETKTKKQKLNKITLVTPDGENKAKDAKEESEEVKANNKLLNDLAAKVESIQTENETKDSKIAELEKQLEEAKKASKEELAKLKKELKKDNKNGTKNGPGRPAKDSK